MQPSQWSSHLLDSAIDSFNSRLNVWLTHHPLLNWFFHHPVVGAIALTIAIILIIRLLLTIYRLIATTIDRTWLLILRSPWLILKLLFGWEFKSKLDKANTSTTITNYEVTENSQQLQDILFRLEQIQQQQQQILQDITSLKGQSPKAIDRPNSLIKKRLPPKKD